MSSKQKVDAFIWSATAICVGIILLSCSTSENFASTLLLNMNSNRMASDKLQLATQNALFDLNQYLYCIAGGEIYHLAAMGEDPQTLSANLWARMPNWINSFNEGLLGRDIQSEIAVEDVKIDPYTLEKRVDFIQLNSIGFSTYPFQDGSVAISASLKIKLTDKINHARFEKFFRIQIIHPVRLYGLYDEFNNLQSMVNNLSCNWCYGNTTYAIARNVEVNLVSVVSTFLAKLSVKNFHGKIAYVITCTKNGSNSCRVDVVLTGIELTDLSGYVQLNSIMEHVTLKANFGVEVLYTNGFGLGGLDRIQLVNKVEN